jgi:hypothetical protein
VGSDGGHVIELIDPVLVWGLIVGFTALGTAVTVYFLEMARVVWPGE